MKINYKLFVLFVTYICGVSSFAQEGRLGIGTENPERTLHVEGGAQIKGLEVPTSGEYSRVLMSDSEGNIEYTNLWSVTPTTKRIWHQQYSTTGNVQYADETKILDTGRFRFRLVRASQNANNDNSGLIQLSLSKDPGEPVMLYLNHEENYEYGNTPDGFQFNVPPIGIAFDSTNWSEWRYPTSGGASQAAMIVGEMNEIFLSYPGENAFYRVLFYRMNTTGQTGPTNSTWIITVEEFGS